MWLSELRAKQLQSYFTENYRSSRKQRQSLDIFPLQYSDEEPNIDLVEATVQFLQENNIHTIKEPVSDKEVSNIRISLQDNYRDLYKKYTRHIEHVVQSIRNEFYANRLSEARKSIGECSGTNFVLYKHGDTNWSHLNAYVTFERDYVRHNDENTVRDVLIALDDFTRDRFAKGENVVLEWNSETKDTVSTRRLPDSCADGITYSIELLTSSPVNSVTGRIAFDHGKYRVTDFTNSENTITFKSVHPKQQIFICCAVTERQEGLFVPCMMIAVHYNPENKCVYQAFIHRIHASSDCASGLAKQLHQNVWKCLREEGYEIKKAYVQGPIESLEERSRGGTPMIKLLGELGFVACDSTDEDASRTPIFRQADHVKVLSP